VGPDKTQKSCNENYQSLDVLGELMGPKFLVLG
jgi:hypothetical protein